MCLAHAFEQLDQAIAQRRPAPGERLLTDGIQGLGDEVRVPLGRSPRSPGSRHEPGWQQAWVVEAKACGDALEQLIRRQQNGWARTGKPEGV